MSALKREAAEVYANALRADASEHDAIERALKQCRERHPGFSDFELRSAVARAIAAQRLDRREKSVDASARTASRPSRKT
jgi:hypothetical protein